MNSAFVIVFFGFLAVVSGYSAGAPEEVCNDMKPGHPADQQKSESFPYVVKVSNTEVKSGDKVQITIEGGKVEKTFRGFFIQVRNGDKAVGNFVIPKTDKYARTVACHGGTETGATHKNSVDKETQTVDWIAPAKFQGKLSVYATVAKDGDVYWVRQKQAEIKVN